MTTLYHVGAKNTDTSLLQPRNRMIGLFTQNMGVHIVRKTKDRYIPIDIGRVVHLWAPDIQSNMGDQ
jgi:hypothetical protein